MTFFLKIRRDERVTYKTVTVISLLSNLILSHSFSGAYSFVCRSDTSPATFYNYSRQSIEFRPRHEFEVHGSRESRLNRPLWSLAISHTFDRSRPQPCECTRMHSTTNIISKELGGIAPIVVCGFITVKNQSKEIVKRKNRVPTFDLVPIVVLGSSFRP